jgi:hypothetical protein
MLGIIVLLLIRKSLLLLSLDITFKTICGKRFRKQFSVPTNPFDSIKIGIISVSELSNNTVNVDSSRLSRKCVLLPDKNNTSCVFH